MTTHLRTLIDELREAEKMEMLPPYISQILDAAEAGMRMREYLCHTLDLPETGLKKNVREAVNEYDRAIGSKE